MHIGVVGGGLTGLATAYFLSQKNHHVTVWEKESGLGGLAATFKARNWQWPVECFVHHFFTSDIRLQQLISKLGLTDKLFFRDTTTAVWYKNQTFPFDSPFSLLAFPHLNLWQKIKLGARTAQLRYLPFNSSWEKTTAEKWLKQKVGPNPYQILWQPLLEGKFGSFAPEIALIWFAARVKKRSKKLGYLQGSSQVLIDCLAEEIRKAHGEIFLQAEVKNIQKTPQRKWEIITKGKKQRVKGKELDAVVVTCHPHILKKIAPQLPQDFKQDLTSLEFLGAYSLVLALKEKLLNQTYWLNILERDFPFCGLMQHTNLVDSKFFAEEEIVYIGGDYVSPTSEKFKMTKQALTEQYLPFLKKINPKFSKSWILDSWLFKARFAQPIVKTNHQKNIPSLKTPLGGLFLACMDQVYPWDRGINCSVELGARVAKLIDSSNLGVT